MRKGLSILTGDLITLPTDDDKLRHLLDVAMALVSELDPETVLDRILEEVQGLTGARFAALGVLNEQRTELERFLTRGVDPHTHRSIGDLPRGRGVLGVLIEDPRALRLPDVGRHPQSFGFPAHHPVMTSFLGVPVLIRGEAWGNLYLTEKEGGGDFTEADEDAVMVLARVAGIAIENARLYETSERRRDEAERALQGLRASRDITDAIAGVSELDRVLELVVKRGRALVNARTVLIMLREGHELVVAASAGHVLDAKGHRLPIDGSTSGRVLEQGRAQRISNVSLHLRVTPEEFGVPDAHTALLVPMVHRGSRLGVLAAFDRGSGHDEEAFSADDEQLLRTFASAAANAVAIHHSVEAERLRAAITAADAERSRWARELHDQTLQALGGLRVMLASTLRRDDTSAWERTMRQAIEDIEVETDNLRAIITDLRPSLLDDLGLVPAIEALIERRRQSGLEIVAELDLPSPERALPPELETTIYRLLQESLTNIAKHARASAVSVSARCSENEIRIEVRDDGVGFDPGRRSSGFGLAGMRERVYLAGGTLDITSDESGTTVQAWLPARRPGGELTRSDADQVAS